MGLGTMLEPIRSAFSILSRPSYSPLGAIDRQRDLIRKKEYTRLGRLVLLIFDHEQMVRPNCGDRQIWPAPNALDWQGSDERPGPWLGLSKSHEDLLLYGNCGHYLGAVPHPPDIRDVTGPVAVDREQRYRDRTIEKLKGTNFLVIEPVHEIIYKPVGVASWVKIRVLPDYRGNRMCFLIDPKTKEGHLVGGAFLIGAAA